MSNAEHEKYGETCCGTRWFRGEPIFDDDTYEPIWRRWMCPIKGCGGEMKYNGEVWPTVEPGYHHNCNKCSFSAVLDATYPRVAVRRRMG